jgi:hypothetical protein
MTIQTESFFRKTLGVEAIRVTNQNMREIAEWCNGILGTVEANEKWGRGGTCVRVPVRRPASDRQTMAFSGDWVLLMKDVHKENSFKVYTDKAFKAGFESKPQDQLF